MKVFGVLFIVLHGQFLTVIGIASVVCPGLKLIKKGCYADKKLAVRPLPVLLFTDRDKKSPVYTRVAIPWKHYDGYMSKFICRCAQMSAAKGMKVFGLQHYGECRTGSDKFQNDGPSNSCITFGSKKCQAGNDCVGETGANFVYMVERVPATKPTVKPPVTKPNPSVTKPGGGTAATTAGVTPTTAAGNKFANLLGQNFVVALKVKKIVKKPFFDHTKLNAPPIKAGLATPAPTVTTPGKPTQPAKPTPSPEMVGLEKKIKTIYSGYPCFYCVKALNSSTVGSVVTVFVQIQFRCVSQHLKKLVATVGAKNIVKAVIDPPPCQATAMSPCGTPCGQSTCQSVSSYPVYPSTCQTSIPAPVSYPVPYPAPYPAPVPPPVSYPAPYSQCPAMCSSTCAPSCSPSCCRSKGKDATKGSKISHTHDDVNDDVVDDEDNDDDDDEDDRDDDEEEF